MSIGKSFSKEETLEMKTGILNEFSDTFEKLLPVYDYLTEQSRTKSETLSGKYLLLRSNFSSNNRYDDTPGKYNYPVDIPNSKSDQMCPGTKAIWFRTTGVPDINFIGYGTISGIEDVDVDQVSMKEFNKSFKELDEEEKKEVEKLRDAIFKDYKEFENEKEGTSEIFDRIKQTKIDGKSTWNTRQSIIRTTKEIYEEITGVTESTDTDMDELVEKILQMEEYKLAIDKNVVKRIIRHLRGRKNVVLVGAPGVGKTVLARKILKIVGKEDNGTEEVVERVAHAEWTKLHVTGGLNLNDEFVPGCVTLAAQEKKWLLIDEFNRADINKAFGEMFLGIESNTIEITPEEAKGRSGVEKDNVIIDIPEKFRMVCTMNDYDKNLLLTELSFGLITRFAFVDIKPNEEEELDSIKAQLYKYGKINRDDYENCKGVVEKFYDFIKAVRAAEHDRMIGVRTCVDVFRYTVSASKEENRKFHSNKAVVFLDEALCDYVLPQFDRLDRHVIESTIAAAKANLPAELVEGGKKPDVFFESLKNIRIRLKQLTSWFDDKSEEEDFIVDKNLEPSGKKTRGKNPKRIEGGKRAWKTSPKLRAKKKSTKSSKNR